jgi:hypothetical protein
MKLIAVFLFCLIPLTAFADQSQSDAEQKAAAYRQTRRPVKLGSLATWGNPNALVVSSSYEDAVVADGMNALTGRRTMLCWEPSQINERSQLLRQSTSSLAVVHSDYEIKKFLKDEGELNSSGGVGKFSGKGTVAWKVISESSFSSNKLSVVAKYDFVLGVRWLGGPWPVLQERYANMIKQGQFAEFRKECGDTYMQEVYEGASLLIIYDLIQTRDVRQTEEELKTALQATFGIFGASGKNTLSKRSQEVLNSYSISSRCYADGATADVCGFIRSMDDIAKAWGKLAASVDSHPESIVAVQVDFEPYSLMLDNQFVEFQSYLNNMEVWEEHRADVQFICRSAAYVSCAGVDAKIDAEVDNCMQRKPSCRAPGFFEDRQILDANNLGYAILYDGKKYTARSFRISFRLDDVDKSAFRPNILYDLHQKGFGNVVSSFMADNRLMEHWALELYERLDGSGMKMSTASLPPGHGWGYVGDRFRNEASSFRLVKK